MTNHQIKDDELVDGILPASHFLPLDEEEAELIATIETPHEIKPIENKDEFMALLKQAVKNTKQKSKPISLRLNKVVLLKLKAKAEQVGISYQSILNALATQYVSGKIKLSL